MIELHAKAKRVGNSWAIIIPKGKADEINLTGSEELHIAIQPIQPVKELFGVLKSKKNTAELMKEIDGGWD